MNRVLTLDPSKQTPLFLQYCLAVLCVFIGIGLRIWIEPIVGTAATHVTFFLMNAVVIRCTRSGPSLVAILLSTLAADWLFLTPKYTLWSSPAHLLVSALFVLVNLVILMLAHEMRRARDESEGHARALRERAALLNQERDTLEAVMRGAKKVHLAFLDRDFKFVRVNDTYAGACGYTPEEMVGKSLFALYPHPENEAIFVRARDSGQSVEYHDKPFEYPDNPERGVTYWDWTLTPVKDAAGRVVGLVYALYETTARKQVELALKKAEATVRENVVNLEQQVQERTAKLRELVQELEHLSYTITHDLRGPLRAMHGFAELVKDDSCPDCEFKGYLHRISDGARRMDTLITDGLQYTRALRTGFQPQSVNIENLLRGVIESYPNLQPTCGDILIEGHFPPVLGNEAALMQCFSNLLDNAVKFVAPGIRPSVRVRAERRPEKRVRFWIEDNGIGIAAGYLPKLFGMFQRATTEYEGTGIGLALVRRNVEHMGGTVGVESELGKGSRFWLELREAEDGGGKVFSK
jgi:PAS domain S-box-containing protein